MKTTLIPLLSTLVGLFQCHARLHLEVLALRQQLAMVTQRNQRRFHFRQRERFFWVWLYRLWPGCLDTLRIFKPDTLARWHRRGFRLYWRWRSRSRRGGRPSIPQDVRDLIRRISQENPLWGAPRVHGELLMLGFEVSQSTVANYMIRQGKPPSQSWLTFLRNQAPGLACVDLFTVPTVTFRILYVLVVLRLERREVIHFNVTEHPTSQWSGQQIVEAFPWNEAPRYLLRDRDSVYGAEFRRRVRSLGIEEVLTAPRSPWQNPYVERLIGSIRRECLNHVIVFNDRHLKRLLRSYFAYYHTARTHLALEKQCPQARLIERHERGKIIAFPHVGGLHHEYRRVA